MRAMTKAMDYPQIIAIEEQKALPPQALSFHIAPLPIALSPYQHNSIFL